MIKKNGMVEKSMKIRKTGYYSILGFLMIALAGCGYTKEEKEAMKRYEKQGRENAENYIEEKYGSTQRSGK